MGKLRSSIAVLVLLSLSVKAILRREPKISQKIMNTTETFTKTKLKTFFKFEDMEISEKKQKNMATILKLEQLNGTKTTYTVKSFIFIKKSFWSNGLFLKFNLTLGQSGDTYIKHTANYFSGMNVVFEKSGDDSLKIDSLVSLARPFNGTIESLSGMRITGQSIAASPKQLTFNSYLDEKFPLEPITVKKKYILYILFAFAIQTVLVILIKFVVSRNEESVPIYGMMLSNFYILACCHSYIRATIDEEAPRAILFYLLPYLFFLNYILILYKRPVTSAGAEEHYSHIADSELEKPKDSSIRFKRRTLYGLTWPFWYFAVSVPLIVIFDWVLPVASNMTVAALVNYGIGFENIVNYRNNTSMFLVYLSYLLFAMLLKFMCYTDNGVNLDVDDDGHLEKFVFFLTTAKLVLTSVIITWKFGWAGGKMDEMKEEE